MKKNWVIILIMSVLLLTLLVPITLAQPKIDTSDLFSVEFKVEGHKEKISCWKSDKGGFFVFLPACAQLSTAVFDLHSESDVYLDNNKITDGQPIKNYELNQQYELTYTRFGKKKTATFTIMQSEKVASMYIQTESGSMEYIHDKKGNNEKGQMTVYTVDGQTDCTAEIASIAGRGNTTWEKYDKKAYSLDLSTDTNLLGMGDATRWVLLANAGDPSNLRNKIVYDFAKEVNLSFSPDSNWVDLYLNGEYAGLYLLCERNDVNKNRVNISEENGVLFSWESEERLKASGHKYVLTDNGKPYRVHYPKNASDKVLKEITGKAQVLENALFSSDGIDLLTKKSWLDIIDLDSWVKKYLIDEMFGNLDGFLYSQYGYYDKDGKIYCGPVWDYDHSLGEDYDEFWSITNPDVFVVGRYNDGSLDSSYISAILGKKEFSERYKQLFKDEFLPKIESFLEEKIPQYITETEAAYKMNKIRWYTGQDLGGLQQEADQICDYITKHNDFLYGAWVEGKEYCKVSIVKIPNDMFFALGSGSTLSEMPKIEDTDWGVFDGLYYCDSSKPFDINKPITTDTELYAKWVDSRSNKLDDIIKLAPLGVFGILFVVVLIIALRQMKRAGDEIC